MRRLAFLVPLFLASTAAAADDVSAGREVFLGACAACHGTEAKGAGPMAEFLNIAVPDLTAISARNGGDFPWLKIVHIVDGRTGLRAHGGPMPVFGTVFSGDATVDDARDGTPVITSARVLDVVDFLAAIQTAP